MKKRRSFGPLLALLTFSLLLGFPQAARAQKLVAAWTAVSALNSPFWVIKEGGFLKQEGVEADFVYIPSSAVVANAMLAGEAAISTDNSQVQEVIDEGFFKELWR